MGKDSIIYVSSTELTCYNPASDIHPRYIAPKYPCLRSLPLSRKGGALRDIQKTAAKEGALRDIQKTAAKEGALRDIQKTAARATWSLL